MGSLCLFTRQQALKMGYFYWLRVKSSNHLHTELNLGYLKGTKFCLESKGSFIGISSIALFKPVLIAWLREYCTFSDLSGVNLKSSPWPKYTQLGTIFQTKIMFYYQTFFPLQICSSLDFPWQRQTHKNIPVQICHTLMKFSFKAVFFSSFMFCCVHQLAYQL